MIKTALAFSLGLFVAGTAAAATSDAYESEILSARLIAAPQGIAPGVGVVSAGLAVELAPGWKTYWRSPGEVGLPPELRWGGSDNVADLRMSFPAPERFRAFGIENYGYGDQVVYPLELTLAAPGEAVVIAADVNLLVCSTICVPEQFSLALPIGPGYGVDAEAAALIADAAARTPDESGRMLSDVRAALDVDAGALTVEIAAAGPIRFTAPDLFPEMGTGAFGAPDIRVAADGAAIWARFPVTGAPNGDELLAVTIVDGDMLATAPARMVDAPPPPPYANAAATIDWSALFGVVGLALLGGLVLNAMPCVLPVLSLKVGAALDAQGRSTRRARTGFLAAAAGVIAVMAALAAILVAARSAGLAVGWGLHFQNPVVVAAMFAVAALFAASLFGFFEVRLPPRWNTALAARDGGSSYLADFSAGAFGALLATPCSAPFLGAAVAYALTGGPVEVAAVFIALGVGLAAPYFVFAAAPGLLRALPKPGPWMATLKRLLGAALAAAAAWLLWVLVGVGGIAAAGFAAAAIALALGAIRLRAPAIARAAAFASAVLLLGAGPASMSPTANAGYGLEDEAWAAFDRGAIARAVAAGDVVFVDVTADWCLTCKANKALTLDREPVASALTEPGVTPMRADWTRPDPAIARYLETHDRFGIPFNVVYGPAAPEGVRLPEILTPRAVLGALEKAGG